MSVEPITEHQHFVPQFYLKQFADPATGEVQILDCELRKIITPRGPKGICKESFFYALETGKADETSQTVEKYLTEIETALAHDLPPIIEKLHANERVWSIEKLVIAGLMSMVYLRGPSMRDWIQKSSESFMKQVVRIAVDLPGFDKRMDRVDRDRGKTSTREDREAVRRSFEEGDYVIRFNNADHLNFMGTELPGIRNLFHGQFWKVYVSRGAGTFVTSENPVSVIDPSSDGFYPPTFLDRTHYLALTPTIMIEASYPHRKDGLKLRRKTFFAGDADKVTEGNRLIAWNAGRYVYAQNREPLEALIPFLRNPDGATRALRPDLLGPRTEPGHGG